MQTPKVRLLTETIALMRSALREPEPPSPLIGLCSYLYQAGQRIEYHGPAYSELDNKIRKRLGCTPNGMPCGYLYTWLRAHDHITLREYRLITDVFDTSLRTQEHNEVWRRLLITRIAWAESLLAEEEASP